VNFHEFAKFVYSLLVFAIADFFDFVPQYFDFFLELNELDDRPFNDTRYFISNDKLVSLGWKQTIMFDDGLKSLV
jgi:dTDP-D-glucose 4,6-dehydratase